MILIIFCTYFIVQLQLGSYPTCNWRKQPLCNLQLSVYAFLIIFCIDFIIELQLGYYPSCN
jgi:hypothetical protein